MTANTSASIQPDTMMKDSIFAALLKQHFGVKIETDDSYLTLSDYQNFMKSIRLSFSYTLLQKLNASPNNPTKTSVSEVPAVSRIESTKKYYILDEIYSILKDNHLEANKLSDDELIYGAAEGMATGTGDEYTQFFAPESSHIFQQSLEGKIAGIGVLINTDTKDGLFIKEVIEKSPAEKAGLQSQDKIIKIDGVEVDTSDGIEDEILRLRGKEKTAVVVTILSNGQTKNVTIIRAVISIPLAEI
jgi:C-terminal processing protease CtpA/Prc